MSRRTKQAAMMSRHTRRPDQPVLSTILSNNPIFFRGDGCADAADPVHALVHDDVPAAVGVAKQLPLPPSRTRPHQPAAGSAVVMSRHGSRRTDQQQQPSPARPTIVSNNPIFLREDGYTEAGPLHAVVKPLPLPPSRTTPLPAGSGRALVMSRHGSGGWVLRRVPRDDPFLAAYAACAKSGGMVDAAPANRQRRKQKKDKNRGDAVQGCGVWSGWATMSCKYGCDVLAVQGGGRPSAAAAQAQASPVPRLHPSRQLVVIPVTVRKRDLERGRAQS